MANTVLITGANKGIGFEVARQLGEKGWTILLGARNDERGAAAVSKLQSEGIRVELVKIDLNDLSTIHDAATVISQKHPELKVLVNNAGIPGDMAAEPLDTKIADLRDTLNVNVLGTFEMIKTFTPILAKNNGQILNMTIPTKQNFFFHPFSYMTSKAALNQMIKMFSSSFKKQHIYVEIYGFIPGAVSTDLNNHMSNPLMRSVQSGGAAAVKVLTDGRHYQGRILTNFGLLGIISRLVSRH